MDAVSWFLIIAAYGSALVFGAGMLAQVLKWWMASVPFPLTKFPAVKNNGRALGKLLADTLLFRSLWRRDMEVWVSGWGFHLFLVLLILGHLIGISAVGQQFVALGVTSEHSAQLSGEIGMLVGIGLGSAVLYLLGRRIISGRLRAISTAEDYAVLGLLLAVILSGTMMRLVGKVDLVSVRAFVAGLITLSPISAPSVWWFPIHFLLVCVLLIWFPFSKLVHSCGVFASRWLITRVYPRQVVIKNDWR